jgi:CO/xanthine dehydrogenase FAD-binding subunit
MSRVVLPRTLNSLWEILEEESGAIVYAGGTDLLVKLRQSMSRPSSLVCLERIEELKEIRERKEALFIGACTTHASLMNDPLIRSFFPVLAKALKALGSPPVRNMGTIGGNICTASPAADTLPPLYVLEAEVEIRSKSASRRMAINKFIRGPGKTSLRAGEIISGIWLKKAPEYNIHHFEKVGQRNALAIAIVSLAAVLKVSDSGTVEKARLAWGSVGPTVVTSTAVEEALTGQPLSMETLKNAGELAQNAVSPIDDVRAGASYRRLVAGNLLWRLIEEPRGNQAAPPDSLQSR